MFKKEQEHWTGRRQRNQGENKGITRSGGSGSFSMATQVLQGLQLMEDQQRNRGKELRTAEKQLCSDPNSCAICCCTRGTECDPHGWGRGVWSEISLGVKLSLKNGEERHFECLWRVCFQTLNSVIFYANCQ